MGSELRATGIRRPGKVDPHRVVKPRVEENRSQPVMARRLFRQVE
jgi:hypothetical protein